MNDEEKAYYEEWKKKCAATRARKKREAAEAAAKAEAKALSEALDAGPGYRRIKSGPNKGTPVWKGSEQKRLDELTIARARPRTEGEQRRAQAIVEREKSAVLLRSIKEEDASKKNELVSPEVILAFIFVFSVSIISFLIAKMFASFGVMGLAIFIDFIFYKVKVKRTRYSRYLPFLWWL